uniref:Uncharacterized protein n=1 Tax=Oryza barthii TaxID=65489 RepID=A0A0D3HRE9_9ORYZ
MPGGRRRRKCLTQSRGKPATVLASRLAAKEVRHYQAGGGGSAVSRRGRCGPAHGSNARGCSRRPAATPGTHERHQPSGWELVRRRIPDASEDGGRSWRITGVS